MSPPFSQSVSQSHTSLTQNQRLLLRDDARRPFLVDKVHMVLAMPMPVFMFAFVSVRTWFVFMSRAMVAMWPGPGLVCVVLSMAMAMMRVSLLDLTWDWDLTRLLRRMYLPAPTLHASWVFTAVVRREATLPDSGHFWDLLTDEHSDQTMQRIPQLSLNRIRTSSRPGPRPRRTNAGGRLADTSWPDSIHPIQRPPLRLLRHARISHNRAQRFCRLGKTVCGRHGRGRCVVYASSQDRPAFIFAAEFYFQTLVQGVSRLDSYYVIIGLRLLLS